MDDFETIRLNVSGTEYLIEKISLNKFTDSLLFVLAYLDDSDDLPLGVRKLQSGNFFVQRPPSFFDLVILPCYLTGKLHIPKWMCPENVLEELKFWRFELSYACTCCAEEISHDSSSISHDVIEDDHPSNILAISKKENFRRLVWKFLDKPSSSIGALIFNILSFTIVLLSTGVLIAFSIKDLTVCPEDGCNRHNSSLINSTNTVTFSYNTDFNVTYTILKIDSDNVTENLSNVFGKNDTNSPNLNIDTIFECESNAQYNSELDVLFSNCNSKRTLQYLELICVVWFTMELILRFIFCPTFLVFVKSPINIIDIFATIPYYLELALNMAELDRPSIYAHGIFVLVQILRCFRVFRILKLARYFQPLRILGRTFKAAKDELCMLILFVMVTVFVFSCLLYQLEKNEPDTQYSSIPASFWWGIITLTTVGYGDMVPKTTGGKVINSIACVAGLMCTAFPVSILVEHFTNAYKTKRKRMFIIPKFKRPPHFRMPQINALAYHTFTPGDSKNLAKYGIHFGRLNRKDTL